MSTAVLMYVAQRDLGKSNSSVPRNPFGICHPIKTVVTVRVRSKLIVSYEYNYGSMRPKDDRHYPCRSEH